MICYRVDIRDKPGLVCFIYNRPNVGHPLCKLACITFLIKLKICEYIKTYKNSM